MAILGIDEVGRGPWAGPLVIGAVILPENRPSWVNELTDSKKLTAKKRETFNEIILQEAPATGLGWVSSREIDEVGLSEALRLAARRAVKEVQSKHVFFDEIIIDGTQNFLIDTALAQYVTILKKADFLIKEVSAASIIAKVARDHYMYNLSEKYPAYGFAKHVGYGTAAHQKALEAYGPCPEHRMSFKPLKQLFPEEHRHSVTRESRNDSQCVALKEKKCSTVQVSRCEKGTLAFTHGHHAEKIVSGHLASIGHRIVACNHKTKFYEIDIISIKENKIYFTEVKYRESQSCGTPLDQITPQKLRQMRFAAESFLKFQPQFKNLNPILAVAAVSGSDFEITDWFTLV